MPITLDGSSLTIEKLVAIARDHEKVELAPEALERIKVCRAMLEEKLANKEIMYGTNTGIGEFSETMLNDEQVKEFQKYLIYNHAAGIGEPALQLEVCFLGVTAVDEEDGGSRRLDGGESGWHGCRDRPTAR